MPILYKGDDFLKIQKDTRELQPKLKIGDIVFIIKSEYNNDTIMQVLITGIPMFYYDEGGYLQYVYYTNYKHPIFKRGIPESEFFTSKKEALDRLIWIEDKFFNKGD
jgi:hypothetical protein